jgi:hypothetical protein
VPDLERVPTDVLSDDLVRVYRQGITRLRAHIGAGLRRGLDPDRVGTAAQRPGDATAAYRTRQLHAARAIVRELERTGERAGPAIVRAAYESGAIAVDRVTARHRLGDASIAGRFGNVHQRQVEVLAANMSHSLTAAARQAGMSVEAVFARAAALEGALPAGPTPFGRFPFIGRRADDPWRRVALETIGAGTVAMDTRRQISRDLAERLIREGIDDGVTGFVDRAGRRWSLDTYTEVVVRTTTREAASRATVGRMRDHGLDLTTISSHSHAADECSPYDGKTFALPGTEAATAGRYEVLDVLPPFHPRCRHVATPAAVGVEEYLDELERAANERAGVPTEPDEDRVVPTDDDRREAELLGADPQRFAEARVRRERAAAEAEASRAAGRTSAIGEVLNVAPLARRDVERGIALVERVHRIPEATPRLPVSSNPLRPGVAGEYKFLDTPIDRPDRLVVDPGGTDPWDLDATVVHELGHFVDHQALDFDGPGFASANDDELAAWRTAVDASPTIRSLTATRDRVPEADRALYDYLLDRREIFARAYAQWVALRAGDETVYLAIKTSRLGGASIQWGDEEFAPIARALDEAFRRKGLTP